MDEFEKSEKRANYKKKLLTKLQREQVTAYVAQGMVQSEACEAVGRSAEFLVHTKKEHPEWAKELNDITTSRVEEYLARIVSGKVTKIKRVRTAVFKDGEQVLDSDGNPVMRLVKEEEEDVVPSQGQNLLWLQAHCPETYGPKAGESPATLGDDVDPAALAADLAARYGAGAKPAPKTDDD